MKLSTLYSRTTNGQVQTWQIEIIDNTFIVYEGILGGKITCSKPTYCEGKNIGKKNETSPKEQAILEAEARHKKKLKIGYFDKIEDIDSSTFIDFQLAKNIEDYWDKIVYPVGLQIKYNGYACIAKKDGMWTRQREKYVVVPQIVESLIGHFSQFPDDFFHGELFNRDLRQRLNELSRILRTTVNVTDEILAESREKVRFYVYDGYGSFAKQDDGYLTRAAGIKNALKDNPYYREVPTFIANNKAEVMAFYEKCLADNEEGAIIRILNAPYEHKRSKYVLKLKPEDDSEAIVLNVIEGTADWAGTGKTFTLKWGEKVFDATLKGTYEQGVDVLKNKDKWIGKEITFLYTGLTGLGIPNYARVDYNNCIKK